MGSAGQQVHLLPRLPRAGDWLASGATAGLLLALAGLGVAGLEGHALPPAPALALLGAHALLVALLTLPLAALLRAGGRRPSHSQMVGAVLAPLGLSALAAPAWAQLVASTASLDGWLALVAALGILALAAQEAAQLGERAERSGTPACGVLVWGSFSLLLVAGAHVAHRAGGGLPPTRELAGLALAGFGLAGAHWLVWDLSRRRGSRPRRPPLQVLALTAGLAAGLVALPGLTPWLLYDESLPPLEAGTTNLLVVAFSAEGSGARGAAAPGPAPAIELVGWQGLVYAPPPGADAASAALALAGGGSLVSRLEHAGYATAALHLDPARAGGLPAGEVRARPGPRRLLAAAAPWLPAVPLLLGPAAPLLDGLGLGADVRTPDELSREARGWLLDWRTRRAPNPFALIVDLRSPAAPSRRQADAALADLLEQLVKLEIEGDTAVLLAFEPEPPGAASAGRLLLRPPLAWNPPPRDRLRLQRRLRLAPGELAGALLELSRADAPRALPGLPAEVWGVADQPRSGSGGSAAS